MRKTIDDITDFSEYLEFKRHELGLTKLEFARLLEFEHHRFNRFIYMNQSPTIEEMHKIATILKEDDLPWLLMLSRRLTPEMENLLFSDYELFRHIFAKGNRK